MKKSSTLLPISRLVQMKTVLSPMVAMLLLGGSTGRAWAQTARTQGELVTDNQQDRVVLFRASAGSVTFTLSPELPTHVDRDHWPIIFIDYTNAEGTDVRQMYNLTQTREFTVQVSNTKNEVKITGENGLWRISAVGQQIKDVSFVGDAPRALELRDNVLGTKDANATFALNDDQHKLPNLQLLDVAYNQLKKVDVEKSANSLKQLDAYGNLLTTADLSKLTQLSHLDLSGNLLTSVTLPTNGFVANGEAFYGGTKDNTNAAYQADLTAANSSTTSTDKSLYKTLVGHLDLSVNKLKISTLPTKPANVAANHYAFGLQERYQLPNSRKGTSEYALNEGIDLSSELKATGVANAEQTTTIKWYKEKDAATDDYELISDSDYEMVNGVTRFRRGFGQATKVFAELTTDAFKYEGTMSGNNAQGKQLLSSYEPTAATNATSGFERPLVQPAGTMVSTTPRSLHGMLLSATANDVQDANVTRSSGTTTADQAVYRTSTITLGGRNYWYGFVSNDWANPENWTMRFVPKTTPTEYAALTGDKEDAIVEFASADPNQYGEDAIRDLHTDGDRVVEKYINKSTTRKALVVRPTHFLTVENGVEMPVELNNGADPTRLVIKAGENEANGSFYNKKGESVRATVELFAHSSGQQAGLKQAKWQYFGVPVQGQTKETALAEGLVRKYNRALNVANSDEKWEAVGNSDVLEAGKGYEITTPNPTRFAFQGDLIVASANNSNKTFEFPVDGVASTTNYENVNILANPFTAAMQLDKLNFDAAAGAEKTIYLFNTGSRENWIAQQGHTTPGNAAGQYTMAIPTGLAGHVAGMPTEIPSLSSFAVKSNSAGKLTYKYADVAKVDEANRARRMDVGSSFAAITVDVASEKSMDRLLLVETPEATDGFDNGYDGEKMLTAGAAQLYAEGERNLQVKSTNRLRRTNVNFIPADKVGTYEMKFHVNGFNAGDEFVLIDKRTGQETPINDGDTYSFVASNNDAPQRFAIVRKGTSLDDAAEASFAVMADAARNIEVLNSTTESGKVWVVDAAGKTVGRFTVAAGGRQSLQVTLPGVYVVKAENSQSRLTQTILVP